jgi:gliding motility-associated-like protein
VDGPTIAGGERAVGINIAATCESGRFYSFNFNLAPYIPAPFGLPADTSFCAGTDLVLEGPDSEGVTYQWSNGDTSRTTLANEPGDYTLRVITDCREDAATVRVTETTDALALTDETLRESVCLGDSLVFQPRLEPGVNYVWSDDITGPVDRVVRESGIYILLRANSCYEATTTLNVAFRDCCQIYLPNAFSPNGDGINDVFRAFPDADNCSLITDYRLEIFNRWGGSVYTGETLTAGWDGRMNDDPAGNGYYVYSTSYFNGLEQIERSGGFVLLR